jgi:hypothetical protein
MLLLLACLLACCSVWEGRERERDSLVAREANNSDKNDEQCNNATTQSAVRTIHNTAIVEEYGTRLRLRLRRKRGIEMRMQTGRAR